MEIVINNIGFEQNEVYCVKNPLGLIEQAVVSVSFYVITNGNRLNGNHEIPFEQYKKMNYVEVIEHIKELIRK